MKVTADRAQLAQTLGIVSRAISSRSTLPILSNLLLEASEGTLELTATDLDTSIRSRLEARVSQSGSTSVSASVLGEVVGSLPANEVELELKEAQLGVSAGKADYSMLTLPAEEFPSVPDVADDVSLRVSQRVLRDMVRQTIFAVAREESNPILTGVLFEVRGGKLSLVATDTHRLAWKSMKLSGAAKQTISVIIPNRPLNEMARLLRDVDDELQINLTENQVAFVSQTTTLVSRVIDGQFPSYEKVIPKETQRSVTANTKELLNTLKRVLIVARENAEKGVLTLNKDEMIISAESQEVGRAREELAVQLDGSPIEIAFNVRYLIDALGVIETENSVLELSGPLNPGLVKAQNRDDFVYVVMPMQI